MAADPDFQSYLRMPASNPNLNNPAFAVGRTGAPGSNPTLLGSVLGVPYRPDVMAGDAPVAAPVAPPVQPTSPAPASVMNTAPLATAGFKNMDLGNYNTVKAKPVSIDQALAGGGAAGAAGGFKIPAGTSRREIRETAAMLPAPRVLMPKDIAIQKYMDAVNQEYLTSLGRAGNDPMKQFEALKGLRTNLGPVIGAQALGGTLADAIRESNGGY